MYQRTTCTDCGKRLSWFSAMVLADNYCNVCRNRQVERLTKGVV